MIKKILSLMIIFFMLICISPSNSFVYADEEDEQEVEEKSDYEKCVEDRDRAACSALVQNKQNNLKQIEKQIAEAEDNREAAVKLANDYAVKAEGMQSRINELSKQIDELQERIVELEIDISNNESLVIQLNYRVKTRMVEAQKTMHFSTYLDFILGSKSFSDMLSRIYGIQAITAKDQFDRNELITIIEQLNKDKAEFDEAKKTLDESYEEIVTQQAELLAMQEFYENEAAKIQEELDAMTEERDNIYESFADLQDILRAVGVSSAGFVAAVHNSWISSTVWNYSDDFLDGNWHLGVDYAASRGTEIHAPASGIVIRSDASCSDPGDLGSGCGMWIAGGGNQVYLMAEVNGQIYGIIFFHLNQVKVAYGDFVLQDEVIGTVGSSGSSTGPHCHIEMYLLGSGNLYDYVAMNWNATFSVGRGAKAYNNRCFYEDGSFRHSPPCILNPEQYLR